MPAASHDSEGRIVEIIRRPVDNVTSGAFGGDDASPRRVAAGALGDGTGPESPPGDPLALRGDAKERPESELNLELP